MGLRAGPRPDGRPRASQTLHAGVDRTMDIDFEPEPRVLAQGQSQKPGQGKDAVPDCHSDVARLRVLSPPMCRACWSGSGDSPTWAAGPPHRRAALRWGVLKEASPAPGTPSPSPVA